MKTKFKILSQNLVNLQKLTIFDFDTADDIEMEAEEEINSIEINTFSMPIFENNIITSLDEFSLNFREATS